MELEPSLEFHFKNIWDLLFDEIMIDEIVQQINVKLIDVRLSYTKQNSPEYTGTDAIELQGFIGLLMLSSICKSGHENILPCFLAMQLVASYVTKTIRNITPVS